MQATVSQFTVTPSLACGDESRVEVGDILLTDGKSNLSLSLPVASSELKDGAKGFPVTFAGIARTNGTPGLPVAAERTGHLCYSIIPRGEGKEPVRNGVCLMADVLGLSGTPHDGRKTCGVVELTAKTCKEWALAFRALDTPGKKLAAWIDAYGTPGDKRAANLLGLDQFDSSGGDLYTHLGDADYLADLWVLGLPLHWLHANIYTAFGHHVYSTTSSWLRPLQVGVSRTKQIDDGYVSVVHCLLRST